MQSSIFIHQGFQSAYTIGAVALVIISLSLQSCEKKTDDDNLDQGTPISETQTFHCGSEINCPRLTIVGDPPVSATEHYFRGYGDPSLEHDPVTGDIWLSYSQLDNEPTDNAALLGDRHVRTHLARSTDGGTTFVFERSINEVNVISHPVTAEQGWTLHEVSTLVRQSDSAWQLLFLSYFDPLGGDGNDYRDYYYARTIATTAAALGDQTEPWARGESAGAFGAQYNLADISEISDCVIPTEPALLNYQSDIYLLTNCVVVNSNGARDPSQERLTLLKETQNGYEFAGTVADSRDAETLGVDRLEQADLSIAQDGQVLLIVTPISDSKPVEHEGCIVFEFSDFRSGSLIRDAQGVAVPRAIVTGEATGTGPGSGPGLCTYDAASATGILMVTKIWKTNPFSLEFVLRATGVHP